MNITRISDHKFGEVYSITRDRQPTGGKPHNMNGARKPRARCVAISDCIITQADGTTSVIPRVKPREQRLSDAEIAKRARIRKAAVQNRKVDIQNAIDARHINVASGRFGYIGNVE